MKTTLKVLSLHKYCLHSKLRVRNDFDQRSFEQISGGIVCMLARNIRSLKIELCLFFIIDVR